VLMRTDPRQKLRSSREYSHSRLSSIIFRQPSVELYALSRCATADQPKWLRVMGT
jgi:hypothetical protein